MRIHKGDNVLVIAGKDKGKKGKVRAAFPKEERLIVEGVNLVKRHMKARPGVRQAGIVEREAPLYASKVMLLCSKCNHPTRVGANFLEDGKKARTCKVCHEVID